MKNFGELLPIDGYLVTLNDTPPIHYATALTHLYQPLIGTRAVMLYQTLFHELDIQQPSVEQTHHTLMNYLNIPLDKIYEARLKLEGIGLLNTFEEVTEQSTVYTYELQRPFTPTEFFKDGMLTELLYHHLGEAKYVMLRENFKQKEPVNRGTEITASFADVFQTFQPVFTPMNQTKDKKVRKSIVPNVNFSSIELMLKQRMIPEDQVLTPKNKKLISEMMFLYDLAPHEIEKSVLWALSPENILDVKEFKIACYDVYKQKYAGTPIKLDIIKTRSTEEKEKRKQPETEEEQLIELLETLSPKELLEMLSSGGEASDRELKMVSEVMTSQGLSPQVMNVLIHYIMIQSDMKLSKAYMETIASHWSRVNLQTAVEAMAFAKKQKNEYKEKQDEKQKRKNRPTEVIPDWFKANKQQKVNKQPDKSKEEMESERQELAALLKEFADD